MASIKMVMFSFLKSSINSREPNNQDFVEETTAEEADQFKMITFHRSHLKLGSCMFNQELTRSSDCFDSPPVNLELEFSLLYYL